VRVWLCVWRWWNASTIVTAPTRGGAGKTSEYRQDFKADAAEAAGTVTPIGEYVLKNAFEPAAAQAPTAA